MAADGMIGNGTKVGYSASSPVSWTNIGQLMNVDGLEAVRDKVDRTVHSSNVFKRNLPGMAEVTDLTLDILADPDEGAAVGAVQEALRALWKNGTTVYWRVEIPVDRAQTEFKPIEFQGWVQRFKFGTSIQGAQMFNLTVVYDASSFDWLAAGASAIS